jgi:Mn2+/Fe2+ NRAMP family transporter
MLNVSAVPILTITLRNNLMEVLPIKKWLRKYRCCHVLLDDSKRSVKGFWSFIISIPVIIIVCCYRNPQVLVTYTGGICGVFILFLIPLTLVFHARKKNPEQTYGDNFNKSPFQHSAWMIAILIYALLTLASTIYGLATSKGSGSEGAC